MQGYVSGFNGAGMWGYTDQLVLIDGVPREANNVKPDEIESISFLKGAQAVVLYGSKAAKGAILITTKRGKVNDGLSVNVRANTGWHVAKSYPEYLGSAEYMTLYNEARANDGLKELYTPETIAKYASGVNPYRYPDVEFYSSEFIKKSYNRTDVTAEIEGGNDRAKFYANVSYYRNGDFLKFGEAKNNYTDRFNVRGNVDVKLNNFINAYVNANATYYNTKSANGGSYWEAAATFRPNRVAPLIPLSYIDENSKQAMTLIGTTKNYVNGCFLGGAQTDLSNIFADYYFAGKNTWTSRQFQFDAGVDVDLKSVTEGLSFHTMVAVDYRTAYTSSFNDTYATFTPTWSEYNGKDVIVALNTFDTVDKHSGVQNISGSYDNQTIAFNAHFDYARTFADVHNVSAMLVANGYQQSESGVYHKVSNANLGLQLGYNFDHKYYADFALAAPWSAKLPEGKRAGFSPSLTLGWNIAGEDFMKDKEGVDDLKLRMGFGVTGNNLGSDLKSVALLSNGGTFWYNGKYVNTYTISQNVNPDLRWEKKYEYNIGIDFSFLQSRLSGNIDLYYRDTKDLLWEYDVPTPPYQYNKLLANAGEITSKGIEIALTGIPVKTRDWEWASTFTIAFNDNKIKKLSDPDKGFNYSEMLTGSVWENGLANVTTQKIVEGESVGTFYGYKVTEVKNNGALVYEKWSKEDAAAGLCDDKEVGQNKLQVIGRAQPIFTYGWNNTIRWRDLDITLFFRGNYGNDILNVKRWAYGPTKAVLSGNVFMKDVHALAEGNGAYRQNKFSDYYLEDGSFFKLDNITVGYTFRFKDNQYIQSLRLHATAENVFTLCSYSGIDPDVNTSDVWNPGIDASGFYPSTCNVMVGVNLTL